MTAHANELLKLSPKISPRRSRTPIVLGAVATVAGAAWLGFGFGWPSEPVSPTPPKSRAPAPLPAKMPDGFARDDMPVVVTPTTPIGGRTSATATPPSAPRADGADAGKAVDLSAVATSVTPPPAPSLENVKSASDPLAVPKAEGKPPSEKISSPKPGAATVRLLRHSNWKKTLGGCAEGEVVCLAPPRLRDSMWEVYGDVFGEVNGPVVAILDGQSVRLKLEGEAFVGVSEPTRSRGGLSVRIEIGGRVVGSASSSK